jgi:hypothetical protein
MVAMGRIERAMRSLRLAVPLAAILAAGLGARDAQAQAFAHSRECMACHNGLVGPSGADVSIGTAWRGSMMANAARDPYWQGTVRRETLDHPGATAAIEHECATCHMPMAHVTARLEGAQGGVFAHLPIGAGDGDLDDLAGDGVSCTVCHQILADGLGDRATFVGRFRIDEATPDGRRKVFGPYAVDDGRVALMRSSARFEPTEGAHIRESTLCATCHTLYTHSLAPDGTVAGELAEQVPYLEWRHSRYADERSCQSCHLVPIDGETAVSSVWGQPRKDAMQHVFRGGNFVVPRLLNAHRAALGTHAEPAELEAVATRTLAHLRDASARVALHDPCVVEGRLEVAVTVANLAGHKLPTAYPSRRAWVHLRVEDAAGVAVFESGRVRPDGSIAGNANDEDAGAFEPHYSLIVAPDQVQIYEPILGTPDGRVTTGLLTATQYLKDNRLLPEGFDPATAAHDIQVFGAAREDPDFAAGGDRVAYRVPLNGARGPFTVTATLRYQPIGFRWARNLGDADAMESQRFVRMFDQAAAGSSTVLATAQVVVATSPDLPETAARTR